MRRRSVIRAVVAAMILISSLLVPLTACGRTDDAATDSSQRGTINVGVQSGLGFSVEGKAVRAVTPGSDVSFTIVPKDGCTIVGFSYPEYRREGNVYTFIGVLYPTVIEVYYTEDRTPHGTSSSGGPTAPATDPSDPSHEDPSDPDTEPSTSAPEPSTSGPEPSTSAPETSTAVTDAPETTVPGTTSTVVPADPYAGYPVNDEAHINSIIYVFNGGTYKNAGGAGDMTVFPSTEHHKRVNVISGKGVLTREGHTLAGWNTMPDGSGEHIGLGSRVTLNKQGARVLFAEWYEWASESDFVFTISAKKASVTGYSGSDTTLVIPGTLGGAPVTSIAEGAFNKIPANKIVFPDTLSTVVDKAFTNCSSLTDLYFFDTITSIADGAFSGCENFSTIHINMLKAPVYITSNGKVEAYDSMILSENKRIVFFAGSSCLYGINAHRAKDTVGDEYDVINLGWTAPRNAMFQVQIIIALLREGDVFVHAPEYLGSYQLMRSVTMGTTAWQVIDCNLDLFSYVDIRTIPSVFSSFSKFTTGKDSATKATFDSYCKTMDDLGYLCTNRKITHPTDWAPEGSIAIKASLLSDTAMTRLRWIYDSMEAKGATVYLTYPPLDIYYLDEGSKDPAQRQGYIDRYKSLGRPVLGELDDSLYSGELFYNTEFHLVTEGANMHTDRVIALLLDQMRADGLYHDKK